MTVVGVCRSIRIAERVEVVCRSIMKDNSRLSFSASGVNGILIHDTPVNGIPIP